MNELDSFTGIGSNSPHENLTSRGAYSSYTVQINKELALNAISQVLTSAKDDPMCVLVQVAISPALVGHLSNERRLSRKKDRWLVEGLSYQSKGVEQRFIRALLPEVNLPRLALKKSELLDNLRAVAGKLSQSDKRLHCEWAWDGRKVWIVQSDEVPPPILEETANEYLKKKDKPLPTFEPSSQLRHYRDVDTGIWKKLRCPKIFDKIGLPTADVYVLPGDKWLKEVSQNYSSLRPDLSAMCVSQIVVRCDIASSIKTDEIFLPTSPASTNPNELIEFMNNVAIGFDKSGISPNHWAFLLAALIPARVSVMVHARPKAERVQIDSLWGFPDGLLHFPHDTYYYATDTHKVSKQIFYKGLCLMPERGSWLPKQVEEPFDWQPTLSESEVVTLGKWALSLSNELDHAVQLMALARIAGKRGQDACLPWHFTELDIPSFKKSVLALPSSVIIEKIESRSDLEKLQSDGGDKHAGGYLIRPKSELLRDSDFLRESAAFASAQDKPIYFEGSLLGHAYYIMSRTGAAVVPIIGDEPKVRTKTYDKLIRDHIPVVIKKAGGLARISEISRSQAIVFLSQKLIEEAFEVWSCSREELVEELADIIEVVEALRTQAGIDKEHLDSIQQKKREKRGGFDKLVYLEETSLRPLKVESNSQGYLPLLSDDNVLPARKAASDSVKIRIENRIEPDEIIHFSLPLVPPVNVPGTKPVWRLEQDDLVVEARFSGNRVMIRIMRVKPATFYKQLSFFQDEQ